MRVLFLTHRLPYAPNRGDRIRAYQILKALAGHAEVHLVSLVHDADEPTQTHLLKDITASVATAHVPRIRNFAKGLAALPSDQPLTHLLLDSPDIGPRIAAVVARTKIDVVLAYCSGMARFALEPPLADVPLVLDMVDVDSQKWAALGERARPPLGWIYRREARCLARFEALAADHARCTLVVNGRERSALDAIAPGSRIHIIGNGIDVSALRPAALPSDKPNVVFCGVFDYAPNVEAAIWFLRHVWPLVMKQRPDAHFSLVGANPSAAVRRVAETLPSVTITGTVADVRPYLWQAALSVAPIWTARGVQNKVLEAAAAGLLCVVTPPVREGLPDEVAPACIVAGDAASFVSAVVAALDRPASERRANASLADLTRLDWRSRLAELPDLLRDAALQPVVRARTT